MGEIERGGGREEEGGEREREVVMNLGSRPRAPKPCPAVCILLLYLTHIWGNLVDQGSSNSLANSSGQKK